jgi:hypothetical protein
MICSIFFYFLGLTLINLDNLWPSFLVELTSNPSLITIPVAAERVISSY